MSCLTALAAKRGIYRRVRQSAPSQPLGKSGSRAGFLLGTEQVAMKFSPEGDPTLVWGRPAGRLPVTFFQVLRLNVLAIIYLIIMGEKSRELGKIFGEKFSGWE